MFKSYENNKIHAVCSKVDNIALVIERNNNCDEINQIFVKSNFVTCLRVKACLIANLSVSFDIRDYNNRSLRLYFLGIEFRFCLICESI